MTTTERTKLFDEFGRNSRASRAPKVGLVDALGRMRSHTYDCKACLRHFLGLPGGRCAVRPQITQQWQTYARAAGVPATETDLAVALLGRQDVSGAG